VAPEDVAARVRAAAARLLSPRPRRVINATGVIVHTNLGRAVLSRDAAVAVAEASAGYLDLEYDLARGGRGRRMTHLAPLLHRLFPGAAALVVNNNAAAVLLALHALARGREVVGLARASWWRSRRFPRARDPGRLRARLKEVGTTNRTRLADYRAAVGAKTAALLKVHPSNFHQVGFTESVSVAELAPLAKEAACRSWWTGGSGDLVDPDALRHPGRAPGGGDPRGRRRSRHLQRGQAAGGPQAGFLVGRADLVRRRRRIRWRGRCAWTGSRSPRCTRRCPPTFAAAPSRTSPPCACWH
jgi:L-seryl-tRNA(Ser) seleniumtransferase